MPRPFLEPCALRMAMAMVMVSQRVPAQEAADLTGLCKETIIRYARGMGVLVRRQGERGPSKRPSFKVQRALELLDQGVEVAQISERLGMRTDSIRHSVARWVPRLARAA